MQRKAFSLLEMSVVLIIISLVMSMFLSFGRSIYKISKIKATKYELQTIKKSLIAYISVQGKLPLADCGVDGIGDTACFVGGLPYMDLSLPSRDKYGMVYQYDVSDSLTNSDDSNACTVLSNIYLETIDENSTVFPRMVDESNSSRYAVAAVIISKGVDKTLSGVNSEGTRRYEMAINKYNADSRDDFVIELSVLELIGEACNIRGSIDGEITVNSPISITAISRDASPDGKIAVYYDIDENKSTCAPIYHNATILANSDQNLTFYQSTNDSCTEDGKTIFETYEWLSNLDQNPNDNIVYVWEENPSVPTITDSPTE